MRRIEEELELLARGRLEAKPLPLSPTDVYLLKDVAVKVSPRLEEIKGRWPRKADAFPMGDEMVTLDHIASLILDDIIATARLGDLEALYGKVEIRAIDMALAGSPYGALTKAFRMLRDSFLESMRSAFPGEDMAILYPPLDRLFHNVHNIFSHAYFEAYARRVEEMGGRLNEAVELLEAYQQSVREVADTLGLGGLYETLVLERFQRRMAARFGEDAEAEDLVELANSFLHRGFEGP